PHATKRNSPTRTIAPQKKSFLQRSDRFVAVGTVSKSPVIALPFTGAWQAVYEKVHFRKGMSWFHNALLSRFGRAKLLLSRMKGHAFTGLRLGRSLALPVMKPPHVSIESPTKIGNSQIQTESAGCRQSGVSLRALLT